MNLIEPVWLSNIEMLYLNVINQEIKNHYMTFMYELILVETSLPTKNGWYFCGGYDVNGKKEPYGLYKFTLSDRTGKPYFSASTQPEWWLKDLKE
jgi:hypothetical protein